MRIARTLVAAFLLSPIALPAPAAAGAADFEAPPVLEAKDLLPPDLLRGPHHEVEPRVTNDGYMNHFTVRSDFGTFEAASEAMVPVRVEEVHALAELGKLSRSEVFINALGASAGKTVKSVVTAVSDPVGTVAGVGEGVGRMFKRMSLGVKKATAAAGEAPKEPGAEEHDKGGRAAETAKDLVGYNSAKRGMAQRMKIDPYSDNEVLQAELDRLSKAAFAGGLAFDTLVPSVPLQGEISMVSDMVWTTSPADLEVMNREKLAAMGVDEKTVNGFYKNRHFTPTTRTFLVTLIDGMGGVENRGAVLDLALGMENRDEALLFVRSVRLLSSYHRKTPLQRVVGRRVLPWGVTADGTTILPAAVDHLVWTKEMAAAMAAAEEARASDSSFGKMNLLVSGTLSARAGKELAAMGWSVSEGKGQ